MATKSSCYESDCKTIHDSWGRLSTLVRTLATRSTQAERRGIRETYKAMYGEDLLTHLQRVKLNQELFSGLFLWMVDPLERDACLAKDALFEGNETDFKALVEIFVARKSSHVLIIKQLYQTRFKRQLDHDILCLELPHPSQKVYIFFSLTL